MTVEIAPGTQTVRHMKPGDTIAEVVGTLHNGVNPGRRPATIVVFSAGVDGQTLTTAPEGPPPM